MKWRSPPCRSANSWRSRLRANETLKARRVPRPFKQLTREGGTVGSWRGGPWGLRQCELPATGGMGRVSWRQRWVGGVGLPAGRGGLERWVGRVGWRGDLERWVGKVSWRGGFERWVVGRTVVCAAGLLLPTQVLYLRGGLVCKAHRLVSHSTLGLRVIKK